jgi:hypothetical protein
LHVLCPSSVSICNLEARPHPLKRPQGEADEAAAEAREAEEKAKKYMLDAAKLAEELRAEQENAQVGSTV